MQLNSSINNNQTSFQSRLYLQNIGKKDLEFFKGIAKDFHKATKDLKGKSYTLKDTGDKIILTSNPHKLNTGIIYKKDINTIIKQQGREGFLNNLTIMAHAIKSFDLLNDTIETLNKINTNTKNSTSIEKTFKKHLNISELNKFTEELTDILEKLGVKVKNK